MLTQTQLATAVADRAGLSKADAKAAALTALEGDRSRRDRKRRTREIGGLVQLNVRLRPAQKARKGRNPATGEEIAIAAKKASVDVKARVLTAAKNAVPSVQKARRRLASQATRASWGERRSLQVMARGGLEPPTPRFSGTPERFQNSSVRGIPPDCWGYMAVLGMGADLLPNATASSSGGLTDSAYQARPETSGVHSGCDGGRTLS